MKRMSIEELQYLSRKIRTSPDPRPNWLQEACDEPMKVASYYLFLYELARITGPQVIIETGTRRGHSAAQFAAGAPAAKVYTMDILESSKADVARFPVQNVIALTGDSLALADQVKSLAPVCDILLLDSDHSYRVSRAEYLAYRPLVRDGGIILLDDVNINPELKRSWAEVVDPKFDAPYLHYMGFGIAVKDDSLKIS